MRFNEFKIVEAPDDGNRGGQEPNRPAQSGLEAGPPYPKEDVDAVRSLQSQLQKLGYSVGSTGIDGKYGPRTTRAVRAFKQENNIKGDGLTISADELKTLATAKPAKKPLQPATGAAELGNLSQDSVTQGKVGQVLDLIAGPESGGRYDAVYPGKRRPQILDMTIDELVQDMRARGRASGSSASGRYQYIRKTLVGVAKSMGLDTATTKFDPETQDKIAIYHLRRSHGLDNWLAGRMSDAAFLNRLAGTWAGIPKSTGGSAYAGVLDNKAGMSAGGALASLDRIKNIA